MSQANHLQEVVMTQDAQRAHSFHVKSASSHAAILSYNKHQQNQQTNSNQDATIETENIQTRHLHSRSTSLIVNPKFDPTLQDVYKRSAKNPLPRQRRSLQSLNQNSYTQLNAAGDKRLRLDSSGQEQDEPSDLAKPNFHYHDRLWTWKQEQAQLRCSTIAEPFPGDDECAFESDSNETATPRTTTPTATILEPNQPDEQIVSNDILDRELAIELVEAGLFELPPGYPANSLSISRQNLLQFRLTGLYLRKISQDFIK